MYKVIAFAVFLLISFAQVPLPDTINCKNESGPLLNIGPNGIVVAASEPKLEDYLKAGQWGKAYDMLKAKSSQDPDNKKTNYFMALTQVKIVEGGLSELNGKNSLTREYLPDTLTEIQRVREILSSLQDAKNRLAQLKPDFNKMDFPPAGEITSEIDSKLIPDANKLLEALNGHEKLLRKKIADLLDNARQLQCAGKLEDAQNIVTKAKEIGPLESDVIQRQKVIESLFFSGKRLSESQFESSRNYAMQARQLDPECAYITQLIGEIDIKESDSIYAKGKELLVAGNYVDAFPELKKSCALDPANKQKAGCLQQCQEKYVDSLCGQALSLIQNLKLRAAETIYRNALEIYPDSAVAAEKYNLLKSAASLYHRSLGDTFAGASLYGNALANYMEAQHYNPNAVPPDVISQVNNVIKSRARIGMAIMDFQDPFGQAGAIVKSGLLSNAIQWDFVRTGKMEVIQREVLDKLFAEIRLSQTGLIDQESAIQTGRVRGVGVFVFGRVTEWNSYSDVQQVSTQSKRYESGSHFEPNPAYQNCVSGTTIYNLASGSSSGSSPYCEAIPKQRKVADYADCSYAVNQHTSVATLGVEIQIIDAETSEVVYSSQFRKDIKDTDTEIKPFDMSCASQAGIQVKAPRIKPLQALQREAVNAVVTDISQTAATHLDPANIWTKKAAWFLQKNKWQEAIEALADLMVLYPDSNYSRTSAERIAEIFSNSPDAFKRNEVSFNFTMIMPPPPEAAEPAPAPGKRPVKRRSR